MRIVPAWLLVLVLSVVLASQSNAHSFNVVLVVPLSGAAIEDGKSFRDGFSLAARERDGHPGEESDGHLGGLDVYLHIADINEARLAGLDAILRQTEIAILVLAESGESIDETLDQLDPGNSILLKPGRLPFADFPQQGAAGQNPKVKAFITAFESAYGYRPTEAAARGYNSGRRIDAAVRQLGGVEDRQSLDRALLQTGTGFDW